MSCAHEPECHASCIHERKKSNISGLSLNLAERFHTCRSFIFGNVDGDCMLLPHRHTLLEARRINPNLGHVCRRHFYTQKQPVRHYLNLRGRRRAKGVVICGDVDSDCESCLNLAGRVRTSGFTCFGNYVNRSHRTHGHR